MTRMFMVIPKKDTHDLPIDKSVNKELYSYIEARRKIVDIYDAEKCDHVESFVVVRATYTNLVLVHCGAFIKEVVPDITDGCTLHDYSMLSCKKVLEDFNANGKYLRDVVVRAYPYPVGALKYAEDSIAIVSHLVLQDDLLSDQNFKLREGFSFVPIANLTPKWNTEKAIVNTLTVIERSANK
jgi:hypothetical protein